MVKQRTTLDKIKAGKSLKDPEVVAWIRDKICYPFLLYLSKTKIKYKVEVLNGYTPQPKKPIIFCGNHQAFPDTPLLLRIPKRRSYVLVGKQNLAFIDTVFFNLMGTIWVDRKSKEDMVASKEGILAKLNDGHSVCWCPEGTWNLTANQLIMPMKWGIIDVARQAGAQIIPLIFDYNRETMVCRAKFGEPIFGADLEDKAKGIEKLRDDMATLRWELMELNHVVDMDKTTPQDLKADVYKALDEYPPLDWEYESSCIYTPHKPVDVLPKTVEPCPKTAFLFNKRLYLR